MKNYVNLFLAVAGVVSASCFAQGNDSMLAATIGNTQLMNEGLSNDDRVIVAYHVEERINMRFGGQITTYTVPNLNLIARKDLGPGNTRVITPIYGKAKAMAKPQAIVVALAAASLALNNNQPK